MRWPRADGVSPAAAARIRSQATAVGLGAGAFGLSFGAVAVGAGFTVPQTCVLSLVAFTGASQFALVGVVGAGGSAAVGVAGALALGARNALYGLRLGRLVGGGGAARTALAAHVILDETTAMAIAQPDDAAARFAFRATAVAVVSLWNVATLVGALAGQAIGSPARVGLDVAFPAAYLALLAPRLRDRTARLVGLAAAAVALATTPFLPVGTPLLVAALVALPAARGNEPQHGPTVDRETPP